MVKFSLVVFWFLSAIVGCNYMLWDIGRSEKIERQKVRDDCRANGGKWFESEKSYYNGSGCLK